MRILKDFEGANIDVRALDGQRARLAVELRDTQGDWFYWAFHVQGAQGQTVTFDFSPKAFVGYDGPAVSHDLVSWRFAGGALAGLDGFTYTFGPGESDVYFCHDLPYSTARFDAFAKTAGLNVGTLCASEAGARVPMAVLGHGPRTLLLTSRHHCCESTGTYVMEGILREYIEHPPRGLRVLAVPFVDLDGVLRGDQGKNRIPRDHNRDYAGEPLYASVRALRRLAEDGTLCCMLDLHSPWHLSGRNDEPFAVRCNPALREAQVRFGKLLETQTRACPQALQYRTENDLDEGVEWNSVQPVRATATGYFSRVPGVELCLSMETPYFGIGENRVTQEKLVLYGRCMARAVARFLTDGGMME